MAAHLDAQIWGVMAASGSGKGVWIKAQIKKLKPTRLVIWDYKDEYRELAPKLTTSLATVRADMLKAGDTGAMRIRYKCKPGTAAKQIMKEFEALCRLVQAWGSCVFLAEELANVTTPGWAPPAWREMTTGGRHEGIHIIGVAQNPALIDKTFLSNCSMIHVGPLREHHHRQTVARSMDVPIEEITALVKFQWIERHQETREVVRGWCESNDPGLRAAINAAKKRAGHAPTPRGRSATATDDGDAGQDSAPDGAMQT
jgi:hypothetical protein